MDFTKVEKKWQRKWKKFKVFEPKLGGKKFFFTVPFPYTSGPPHIGHGRTFTIGDFIARFKRKQGFNVLWPMGFHRSGTPILAISDRIKRGDKKYIDLFSRYVALKESDPVRVKEIIKSFEDPENVANFFAGMLEDGFNELGLSIDWTRKFKTGSPHFNKFVEWQYEKLMNGGALVQGSHPVTYCTNCKNAVGEDDIKDGDTDKVSINEFSAIKFKLGDKFIVASTLRPETIYGITNLWVNPESVYVEVLVEGEVLIVSAEAFDKLSYQVEVSKLAELTGSDLIGKVVVTPIGSEVPILPGSFVDPDVASGVVYSVPAHAPFDFVALRDLQSDEGLIKKFGLSVKGVRAIKPVVIIDIKGYSKEPAVQAIDGLNIKSQLDKDLIEQATKRVYKDEFYNGVLNSKCGEFAGLKISDVKDSVFNKLKGDGLAFTFYETSRKAVCRCTGKIIIALLNNQWFIDYSGKQWKDKTRGLLKSMTIIDDKYRKSFIDAINWVEKRPCARRRGIGTRLPYDKDWVIESLSDSTIYMAFYTINKVILKYKLKVSQLTPELFDFVFLGKGDFKDKWAIEMREQFTYWYPNDHRHTAPAHISNHLLFFLFHHTLIFPKKYWPKVMTFSGMLIREGAKMSKSKGNVIPLVDISRKYSADLYRMFVLSSSDMDSTVDWRESEVASIKSKLNYFFNIALKASSVKPASKFDIIDKWIISRFYSRLKDSLRLGDDVKIRSYIINLFFEFLNELGYYQKRVSSNQFNSVVKFFLKDWLIALEPVIPHLCEEVWSKFNDGFVSLAKFSKINSKLIDESIESAEGVVINTVKDVSDVLKLVKFKPKKVSLFVADEWKFKLFKVIKSVGKLDFKLLINESLKNPVIKAHGKEVIKIIQSVVKNPSRIPKSLVNRDIEYSALNEAIKFFEREFGIEFDIVKAGNPKALPGKPGIIVE